MTQVANICLIGFGEVGRMLFEDMSAISNGLSVWDILFDAPDSKPSQNARATGVRPAAFLPEAVNSANLVISAVTAGETLNVAEAAAKTLERGAVYLDLNSASPKTKIEAASVINEAGGRYVEAAIMSPVAPKRLGTPILIGGPYAEEQSAALASLGFTDIAVSAPDYGKAAATKMCRSVIVKGMEALLTESLVAARRYGVDDTVLSSLNDLFPGPDWTALSAYMMTRSLEHGARRAEEMREAAETVADAGLTPSMSRAAAERQDWAALQPVNADGATAADLLDQLLQAIDAKKT